MDWPEFEIQPPRWVAGDKPLEAWHGRPTILNTGTLLRIIT